ncbi:MAG: DUF2189 domain-containing protein [Rhodocyclales bacterium]|nr:DUF2189 domain-containing protein [Rhodocyclales bacterium]
MAHPFASLDRHFPLPRIRQLPLTRIADWLAAGWQDFKQTPIASLAYGLLFAIAGDLLLVSLWRSPQHFAVAVSGFFIVAPLLCAGLYELSRRSERGLASRFADSLAAFARGRDGLTLFGLLLVVLWVAWERLSAALFASVGMAAGGATGNVVDFALRVAADGGSGFVFSWLLAGAIVVLAVFMLSVVSVPLLVDRGGDFVTAAMTSLRAFGANAGPLLLWAATIVALTLLGFATLLFGLIVLMPLLGHASWHAYRDLVE